MFNRAVNWSRFLGGLQSKLLALLPPNPVVVEIGHGDGSFLSALKAQGPKGRYVGFDPHGAAGRAEENLEFRTELFNAQVHLQELRPDLVISRHVLEHLMNPLGFLQTLAFGATAANLQPFAYFEVPCIDTALTSQRTVDFYYEHSSQFTTQSFAKMLSLSVGEIIEIGHGYGKEVVFGLARLGVKSASLQIASDAHHFQLAATKSQDVIAAQLSALYANGKRIAIWGGTGKSAAFMCRYGVDCKRFPIVVDSDRDKVGTFVPGTGQEIQYRDYLLQHPVDGIIIPPQWRASDIAVEMTSAGISVDFVMIEHAGKLIDFHRDEHPYRSK